ncbi:hypothetical protein [Streptomyces triticiradicis]|uniref:Uncharacterized protein n=1 Tax=Streptomyces triticiradicis TaxID=2651189 RepID=A0A7J5DC37_9ACTN|nr:hypothetical protein [Streptomyces triticiradicis]KAB1986185.1 hypothetical protein F8144_24090 [Streptomyces triticiradicis]
MKLLMVCWRAAAARSLTMLFSLMFMDFVNDGFTWHSAGGALVLRPPVWAVMTLGWAAVGVWSLRRRARTAGVALSVEVLDGRQKHVLRPARISDGWQERVREQLVASERSFLVAEKGREEIHFRWRPGRLDRSVRGSMSFDEPSGGVVLDVHDGEALPGVAGLGKGSAFTALCQMAGATGLEAGALADGHPTGHERRTA